MGFRFDKALGQYVEDQISETERTALENVKAPVKNNLTATAPPTINDNTSKGFSNSSVWVYSGTTYICIDADKGTWSSSADIFHFNTYSELVAAISVAGSTYVGKYCEVANANGAPSGDTTYTAPAALTDTIVDGGAATIKVLAQGATYKIETQTRTIVNPIVSNVMLVAAAKPTTKGYYIFTVNPTDGLPTGIGLNDIAYFNGTSWSMYQKYTAANTVLVANSLSGTQSTWRKFNGTWMNTADEYIPDGKEYQTGKLWNGKPVYRRCVSKNAGSTLSADTATGIVIPSSGTMLLALMTISRVLSGNTQRFTIAGGDEVQLWLDINGSRGTVGAVYEWHSNAAYSNQPFTAWVEYTKN